MTDARVAIFGLGRSGVSAARAVLRSGGQPIVYDEGSGSAACLEEPASLGVPVATEWRGAFTKEIADIVVTSPGVPRDNPKLTSAVEKGLEVIGEVELAYRVAKAPIVAITGTNGKSTTTVMTYLALNEAGQQPVLCGNIYGSGYSEVPLTEAAIDATEDQVLVAEVSSFQLEWIRNFKPVSAGITNIWEDHLNRYGGSLKEYAATKQRIFQNQTSEDFAVVRALDPLVKTPKGPTVLTFGSSGEHAQVEAERLTVLGTKIDVRSLPFREPHNLQNAAMALLLGYGLMESRRESNEPARTHLEAAEALHEANTKRSVYSRRSTMEKKRILPQALLDGLMKFEGLAHRMERVGVKNGITIVNNSMCTNVDAILKSATAIADAKHLLIGGINKGLDFKPLRNYLANRRDKAYLYGRDREQLANVLGGQWPTFETMEEAFQAAAEAARPGETIMLSPGCASQDQFEDFRDRGNVYKQLAKEWLEK